MATIGRGFDIDGFRAVMKAKGVAKTNLYKMVITPPRGLVGKGLNMPTSSQDVEDIMLYCESVTLPGLSVATSDSRPYGYGPIELKGYAPVFNEFNASFIVDNKSYTLSFFRNWIRGIVNYTGEGKSYTSTRVNGALPFEASYKAEYETNMQLYVLSGETSGYSGSELNVDIVSRVSIIRAFPKMIGDVVLSYGVTDKYLSLPVTFSYFDWYGDNLSGESYNAQGTVLPGANNNGDFSQPKDYNIDNVA